MFQKIKAICSYDYAASSWRHFWISRIVTLIADVAWILAVVVCWLAINYAFTLVRYALGA